MKPAVAVTVAEVRAAVAEARRQGRTVGLVPTMGALHEGHAALVRTARAATGFVVVSIFVNPTQFGPKEDFQRYPRPLESDLLLSDEAGADLAFAPEAATVYPPGFCTFVEVQGLSDGMEGAARPGHFRGVATVVLKLFNMVGPDVAFFGQKDGQQARVIAQMVRDLDVPVKVQICPTVRAADGLALSSRNQYLDADQRSKAVVLHAALTHAADLIRGGERDATAVRKAMTATVAAVPGALLDYADVVDAHSLRPLDRLGGQVLLALAVKLGTTRLIDNLPLDVPESP